MPISMEDERRLKDAGFLNFEIEQFAAAKSPSGKDQPFVSLDTPVWRRVMDSRRAWIQDKIEQNWTDSEIENELMGYYQRDKSRSPWDFIRVEYKPPTRVDYKSAVREQKKLEIEGTLGKY